MVCVVLVASLLVFALWLHCLCTGFGWVWGVFEIVCLIGWLWVCLIGGFVVWLVGLCLVGFAVGIDMAGVRLFAVALLWVLL